MLKGRAPCGLKPRREHLLCGVCILTNAYRSIADEGVSFRVKSRYTEPMCCVILSKAPESCCPHV